MHIGISETVVALAVLAGTTMLYPNRAPSMPALGETARATGEADTTLEALALTQGIDWAKMNPESAPPPF